MKNESAQKIKIKYLPHHEGLPELSKMTSGSSGYDVVAACGSEIIIKPSGVELIPTGFKLSMPEGIEAQVRPRSGLALKKKVTVLNSPGTIDSDYRGEVKIILANFGSEDFVVKRGDRIAQIVFSAIPRIELERVDELDETSRGAGGFGHTG